MMQIRNIRAINATLTTSISYASKNDCDRKEHFAAGHFARRWSCFRDE